jgi:hypothetical protein
MSSRPDRGAGRLVEHAPPVLDFLDEQEPAAALDHRRDGDAGGLPDAQSSFRPATIFAFVEALGDAVADDDGRKTGRVP